MPAYTRRQLKEDKFAKGTQEAVHWATEHRQLLIMAIGTILVVGIAVTVFLAWTSHQSEKANLGLGKALQTSVAPVRPPNTPADPTMKSFASMAERAREAEKQFKAVADQYPHTSPGKIARYLAGTMAAQTGDNAEAERLLKSAADERDKSISSLAKLALANLYRATNRPSDAAKLYKDLTDNPTDTVSKAQAQLQLAEMYETIDPQEAKNIYEQIQKTEDPRGAGGIASSKLANLNK